MDLRVSLVLKAENKQKHNSMAWFFNGFVRAYNSSIVDGRPSFNDHQFAFLSDCGTLFKRSCLFRLVRFMLDNPHCSGSTGRQRVMDAEMQVGQSISSSASIRATIVVSLCR